MLSGVADTVMPKSANTSTKESTKKLAYLKKPSIPRLVPRLHHNRSRRRPGSEDRWSACPATKSTRVDSQIRDRNRQSHQP